MLNVLLFTCSGGFEIIVNNINGNVIKNRPAMNNIVVAVIVVNVVNRT